MKPVILAAFAAIAAMPAAHAQVFGTGALYGGPTQATAVCYIFNEGSKAVTLSPLSLFIGSGAVAANSSTCPATLAASKGCAVGISGVSQSQQYSCAMQPVKSATLRGSLELRDGSNNILAAQDMR